jgi:hypothetical protein
VPEPEPTEADAAPAADEFDQPRRALDEITGQLEWVQDRLDELDAAAAAAADSLSGGRPSGTGASG